MSKVYVLRQSSYGNEWFEIEESELSIWLKDGRLKIGDIIVYPEKNQRVVCKIKIEEQVMPDI